MITVPALILYEGQVSYNSLEEIGEDYDSVKGFNIIADRFSPGQTMPTSVLFKLDEPVESKEHYQDIAVISQALAQLDGVEEVRSVISPAGTVIDDFF